MAAIRRLERWSISMVEEPTGKPRTTWNDFVAGSMKPDLLAPRPHP